MLIDKYNELKQMKDADKTNIFASLNESIPTIHKSESEQLHIIGEFQFGNLVLKLLYIFIGKRYK